LTHCAASQSVSGSSSSNAIWNSCGTFIALGHTELGLGDVAHVDQILEKVHLGIETIENFIGELSSTDDQARLAAQLEKLKATVGELEALVKNRARSHSPSPR
jgi:hypothetical protein